MFVTIAGGESKLTRMKMKSGSGLYAGSTGKDTLINGQFLIKKTWRRLESLREAGSIDQFRKPRMAFIFCYFLFMKVYWGR